MARTAAARRAPRSAAVTLAAVPASAPRSIEPGEPKAYKVGGRDASAYQGAIFADVESGEGHTVVRARAGTGKTSTIVAALACVPAGLSVLFCAFNKSIATELASKAPAGVEVSTLHAFGFSAIRNAFRGVRVDGNKLDQILRGYYGDGRETIELRTIVGKIVTFAKGALGETPTDLAAMIDRMLDAGQIDWPADTDITTDRIVSDVTRILAMCKRDVRVIDFDDMIWFVHAHNLGTRQFDRVFVDETQDLNKCQIEIALKACKPGGRICAVGDDRQAIYAFRGADAAALDNVVSALAAQVLPLSITYRCARSIVALAAQIVPDYEAAPTAPEGEVVDVSIKNLETTARPGDFVISRTNAPLVGLCLAFLRAGVPAHVAGRDVGASLITLIRKSKASTIGDLTAWIDSWRDAEIARLSRRNPPPENAIETISDRAECIHALCEGASSPDDVIGKIERLFSDTDDSRRIVLTTVHKAKGLERDRAWLLAWTFRAGKAEEDNLRYVAITRARHVLGWVSR